MSPDTSPNSQPPKGLTNIYAFSAANAASFQIVLGSAMILYAKSLQASATYLGLLTSLTALLNILQIPAANFVDRVGYRTFVFRGWGTRIIFIFFMALVPFSSDLLDPATKLALMLFLMFAFNFSRGISSCGWLPWVQSIVPESHRGRYLTLDQICINTSSLLVIMMSGMFLGKNPMEWKFGTLFFFSFIAGLVSLFFLVRIPDAPASEMVSTSKQPVPWKAIWEYEPFQKMVFFSGMYAIALGALNTFTVAFLKAEAGFSDGVTMLLMSMSSLGSIIGLFLLRPITDRVSSKPLILVTSAILFLLLVLWTCTAGKIFPAVRGIFIALLFAGGATTSLFHIANIRLLMSIVPKMGRSHFFALHTVVNSLILGVVPILWGVVLDLLKHWRVELGYFHMSRYAFFYLALTIAVLFVLLMAFKLPDKESEEFDHWLHHTFIDVPARALSRLWHFYWR